MLSVNVRGAGSLAAEWFKLCQICSCEWVEIWLEVHGCLSGTLTFLPLGNSLPSKSNNDNNCISIAHASVETICSGALQNNPFQKNNGKNGGKTSGKPSETGMS